jgi:hypothetical protein
MNKVTPLLAFLRALEPDQRKAFADEAGTTVVYLYQLAGQPWPNPKLKLSMLLVEASAKWAGKAHGKARPLSFEDLLVGTSDDPPGTGPY